MNHLVIFASGSGTNAEQIMKAFELDHEITVAAVFTNNPEAGVIERAEKFGVPVEIFDKKQLEANSFGRRLDMHQTDFLVLAGFLWKIPNHLLSAYPDKILNIHPALLPKFGGKGMYGERVHQAVIESGEKSSGITIHLVNDEYDDGKILFQAECTIDENETSQSLAQKIHVLEYKHFPKVIHEFVLSSS